MPINVKLAIINTLDIHLNDDNLNYKDLKCQIISFKLTILQMMFYFNFIHISAPFFQLLFYQLILSSWLS